MQQHYKTKIQMQKSIVRKQQILRKKVIEITVFGVIIFTVFFNYQVHHYYHQACLSETLNKTS